MKNISKTIVFFGTDDFSLASLNKLIGAGYNVAAVVTKPDSKKGRGQNISYSDIKNLAIKKNIAVWQPEEVTDINKKISELKDKPVGILVSYGKIIPKSTIDLFKPGIINIHPSILPSYRGPSPIESTIENGDSATGVTIMRLTPKMDAGEIYSQEIYDLTGEENRISLRKDLAELGAKTIVKLLPSIIDGTIKPVPQDEKLATYCRLLQKDDAIIDTVTISAVEAERLVRAHLGYPKTKLKINNAELIITKSHVSKTKNTILDIPCSDGNFLSIDELIAPSGRTMSARDYINGYAN